ncbi:MAG: helix-turn-helix domain-containing protein [Gammaproteobacteria bacterium]
MKTHRDDHAAPSYPSHQIPGRVERNSHIHDRIAGRIRASRLAAKLSQQLLADRLGVDQAHLSRIESRKTRVSVDLLLEIARATGVTIDYLCFGHIDRSALDSGWQPTDELAMLWECLDQEQQMTVLDLLRLMQSSRRVSS